ncbi:hypothetical protein GCWU000324_01348 [Kingella oralis ATCC 51147]|uniref:Uncharacterized protein n=1 Tax=Kingella oralis ATCC 51147 TaxID=629741 RepID=C4GGS8_9NEIS|nr:hypothetical protein GCWU000324_01348 [Kingella oralis ATCC 51147]
MGFSCCSKGWWEIIVRNQNRMNRYGGGVAPCPCGVEATKQTAQRARTAARMVQLCWRYYGTGVKICLEFFVMVKREMIVRVA